MEHTENLVAKRGRPAVAPLSPSEISAFCAQLAMILKSGISMEEGISIMLEDTKDSQGQAILSQIKEQIDLRETMSVALDCTGKFPSYMIHMVEIGERSGKLDEVMDSLCIYYEREEAISRSIKSAVAYPLVMIVMMALVIGVLIVKVLPVFNEVFLQLGSEMTGISKTILNAGQAMGRYSTAIIIVAAAIAVILFFVFRSRGGGSSLLLTRKLSAKVASGRFASAMSMMLSSGLDTDQSLEMAAILVDHKEIRSRIAQCQNMISEGEPFSDSVVKAGLFTGVYARMIAVGFKTGSVDDVMKKLADRYEEEIDNQISSLISILEPTLVAILSIIVGMILLSVMLPLMGIMSSIG